MASVHLALLSGAAGFQKLVALKLLKPSLAEDVDFMAMFLDEARLAARLNHPNVVQTYEVGRRGNQPFIAMEFIEGQPLSRMQRLPDGGVSLPLQLSIIADMLSGLHHAHELRDFGGASLGVVHRDVSPQNVLVSFEGQAKVVDFGIAKAQTQANETGIGVVKGKLSYMSPEQAAGEPIDRRSDLFAVGIMLWEAGARKRLWPNISLRERLQRLEAGAIPELAQFDPSVPSALDRICRRALSYSPDRRYQSAAELELEIQALLSEPALRATRRDVAAFMSLHFEAQRARTRRMIEEQLGHLSVRPAPPREPSELLSEVLPDPVPDSLPEPLSDSLLEPLPGPQTPSNSASTLVVESLRLGSLPPWGRSEPPPPATRPRAGFTLAVVGAPLALLLGVGGWWALHGQAPKLGAAAARGSTESSPTSSALRPPPLLPAAAPSASSEPLFVPLSPSPLGGAGSSGAARSSPPLAPKPKVLVSGGQRRATSSPSAAVDEHGVSDFGGRR